MDLVLRSIAKAMREHESIGEVKIFLDSDYADGLRILDDNVIKWINF